MTKLIFIFYPGSYQSQKQKQVFLSNTYKAKLKEINFEYSLEGLMLKLQDSGHLTGRANSLQKTLMLGKIEDKRKRGQQRMRWLDSITDSMDMNLSKLKWWMMGDGGGQGSLACCSPWGHRELDMT